MVSRARQAVLMATLHTGCADTGDATLGQQQDPSQDFTQSIARYADKQSKTIEHPSRNRSVHSKKVFTKKDRQLNSTIDQGQSKSLPYKKTSHEDIMSNKNMHEQDAVSRFLQETVKNKKNYLNKIVVMNPSPGKIKRLFKKY